MLKVKDMVNEASVVDPRVRGMVFGGFVLGLVLGVFVGVVIL